MNIYDTALVYKEKIMSELNDDESCHSLEDALMKEFIDAYGKESEENMLAARSVIREIRLLEFSRWCA